MVSLLLSVDILFTFRTSIDNTMFVEQNGMHYAPC